MNEIHLFTDGSVNIKTKVGFGAYLMVENPFIEPYSYQNQINLKRFENTSSTKLELETLLFALKEVDDFEGKIVVYTDSQNIISLIKRRKKLEGNNYQTSKNKPHKNHEIYKEFFAFYDTLNIELIKVQGHLPKQQKKAVDLIFSMVDKASRKALKNNPEN